MKTKKLVKEDVKAVAESLKMNVTDEVIEQVLNDYDDAEIDFPNDNWTEIVETLLYRLVKPFKL